MPKASTNAIITIIRNAQHLGVDIDVLQKRVGITSHTLEDPDKRIDSLIGFKLMEEAERLVNNPMFGLRHGRIFQPADMGLVGFLVLNASTILHALQSFCKFQKIYGEGMRLETSKDDTGIKVTFIPHLSLAEHCTYSAYHSHMSGLITTVNWLLNDTVNPISVMIGNKPPVLLTELQEFSDVFGGGITYSATHYAIIYNESDLNRNVLTKNPELFKLFEHRAKNIIDQLGQENDFKMSVALCLLKILDGEKPSLEKVASQLHKSTRTIQRLLKLENTSFQKVLDEVRHKSASYYLETSSLSIDEISYLSGFSESSAFRKSFKKWFKTTPEQFRKGAVK